LETRQQPGAGAFESTAWVGVEDLFGPDRHEFAQSFGFDPFDVAARLAGEALLAFGQVVLECVQGAEAAFESLTVSSCTCVSRRSSKGVQVSLEAAARLVQPVLSRNGSSSSSIDSSRRVSTRELCTAGSEKSLWHSLRPLR